MKDCGDATVEEDTNHYPSVKTCTKMDSSATLREVGCVSHYWQQETGLGTGGQWSSFVLEGGQKTSIKSHRAKTAKEPRKRRREGPISRRKRWSGTPKGTKSSWHDRGGK